MPQPALKVTPSPLTEVKKLLKNKPEHIRDTQQEILNYNQALQHLHTKIDQKNIRLSQNLVLKIHQQITHKLLPQHQSGKYRKKPVIIYDVKNKKIQYIAPDWKDVPRLIGDLLNYVSNNIDKIDSLILAGIFHRQFVIIHPFIDGSGRSARLLTTTILASLGINVFKLFSFENYYNQNVTKYIQKVGSFGDYYDLKNEYNFTNWLEYFTDGIIDEFTRVQGELKNKILLPDNILKPHDVEIVKHIKKHGSIAGAQYAKITDRAKATRNQDFNRLIGLGHIQRIGKGKATYYILPS